MGLRDILLFAIVFGSLPLILWRPYIGVLMWSWLAYMNPHRLTYMAAYDFRFSIVVGATLVLAVLFSRESKRIIWSPLTVVWLVFFVWTWLSTTMAFFPDAAAVEWSRWWKINLMSLITLMVMQSRERLHALTMVIAWSLAFFGVKGGVFAIATGGSHMVFGPEFSFIGDNTSLGLALVMTILLLRYLQLEATKRLVKLGLTATIVLTIFAVLATQSRGALLGLLAIGAYLIVRSPKRLYPIIAALILAPLLFSFMPSSWHERMGTIATYDTDGSALGRINAWWFAFNLAKDHPIFGGGFHVFDPELFRTYAPDPDDFHDAHSIYFEVLAEQGFVGLAVFLLMGWLAFRTASWVINESKTRVGMTWAGNLAAMIRVSLVGYAVSGAFLGLAYFDLLYHLIVMLVIMRRLVQEAPVVGMARVGQPIVERTPIRAPGAAMRVGAPEKPLRGSNRSP